MRRTDGFTIRSRSASETERIGAAIGERIAAGLCVVLVGGLGAGKTVFARGICRGLGVVDEVLSPTFILFEQFQGRLPVTHVDLYRLEHESELDDIGLFDMLGGESVILAEWGDRSNTLAAAADIVVTMTHDGAEARVIDVRYPPALGGVMEGVAP